MTLYAQYVYLITSQDVEDKDEQSLEEKESNSMHEWLSLVSYLKGV